MCDVVGQLWLSDSEFWAATAFGLGWAWTDEVRRKMDSGLVALMPHFSTSKIQFSISQLLLFN
jgi:hypothetical protein